MSHPFFANVLTHNWANDLNFSTNLLKFTEAIKIWNKEVFGNIFHRKRRVEARLAGIQKALANGQMPTLSFGKRVEGGVLGNKSAGRGFLVGKI